MKVSNEARLIDNFHITASCSSNEMERPELIYSGRSQTDGSKDFIAMRNSDGEIKVFNPADLIA